MHEDKRTEQTAAMFARKNLYAHFPISRSNITPSALLQGSTLSNEVLRAYLLIQHCYAKYEKVRDAGSPIW